MPKTFNLVLGYKRPFFPDCILDRLEERMRNFLNIEDRTYLEKDMENSKKGLLELPKSNYCLRTLEEIEDEVNKFYVKEGFRRPNHAIGNVFFREKDKYSLFIAEHERSFSIVIA